MDICIDTEATLQRFSDAEISVTAWCEARGFQRRRFYYVVNNQTLKSRTCLLGKKIYEALKKEGLLVPEKPHTKAA